MTNPSDTTFIKLKTADATKLGRNGGSVTYVILCDSDRKHIFLSVVGNSGGGYWSREEVGLDAVEKCLPEDRNQPLSAKSLAVAFISRSSNNPSFCAAVLRAEGLLGPVEGKPYLHQVAGDWSLWRDAMLKREGSPYVPAGKEAAPVEVVVGAEMVTGDECPAADPLTAITNQEPHPDADADENLRPRKGRKNRTGKLADEADHAHPA